jgi:predicted CXXCH cytochrome family protein
MKIFRLSCTLLLAVAFASFSFGQITGTAHDFSGETWSGGEICIACHTPHNGNTSLAGTPLWNHDLSTATYTIYSSNTLDATVGQPSGQSSLCLACHDGTVALDSYGGATGTTFIDPSREVGTDLDDDHPISFPYDAALIALDDGLHDPATASSGLGGTISQDLLFGGNMQCASCHDVHGTSNTHLLRITSAGSLLCLTCHDK